MNETDIDADLQQVRRYLLALPAASPPAGLGERVLRRHRWRRQRTPWALAAALALLALLPALPDAPPVPARPGDPQLLLEIRALDRELQRHYQQSADAAETAALWHARSVAIARLDDPQQGPMLPVRL